MKNAVTNSPRARPRRPWVIPPALLHLPFETLRGTEIIRETPNEFGLVLWHLHRDVELWAAASANERSKLFRARQPRTSTRVIPQRITAPLSVLRAMLAGNHLAGGATACNEIAVWATPRAPATALLFAQAGAMLETKNAIAAHMVAVHANDAGYPSLAVNWANRAMALARPTDDWNSYAAALIEIARANCAAGGDTSLARSALARVLLVHRRRGLHPDLRAHALLNLFQLALGTSESTASTTASLQRAALRCYASSDPRRVDVMIALARSLCEVGRNAAATSLFHQHTGVLTREQAGEVRKLFAPPVPSPAPAWHPRPGS